MPTASPAQPRTTLPSPGGIVVPTWRDPRLPQIAILLLFTILGQTVLAFDVSPLQVAVALVACWLLDAGLTFAESGTWVLPASGTISGLSIGLLLRSPDLVPFVIAAFLTIGSKHVLRWQGRHVFNPSNFGIAVVLLLPFLSTRVMPGQWGTSWLLLFLVFCLGAFMANRVNRWALVGSFAVISALLGPAIAALEGQALIAGVRPLLTATLVLFIFFMLTDPRTSPSPWREQLLVGAAVAMVNQALALAGVPYAIFLALALVCLGRAVVHGLRHTWDDESPWRTRTVGGQPSGDGPDLSRRALVTRTAVCSFAIGAAAAVPALANQRASLPLDTTYVVSGGGVNLKYMPDDSGKPTIPMREAFSFDRYRAMCVVENNPQGFVMPTFALGKVPILPNSFFMAMYANVLQDFNVATQPNGSRKVTFTGNLDCYTAADTAQAKVGSRTVSEPASYQIEAVDSGQKGATSAEGSGDSFAFTVYFNKDQAPTNHAIFGPKVTFTGKLIAGGVSIRSLKELLG